MLQLGAAGDGGDGLLAGGGGDLADAVELLDGPVGGQVLLVEVGVSQVGVGQPVAVAERSRSSSSSGKWFASET